MAGMMEELLKPQYTAFFVVLTCAVFAWIGYMGHDDGEPPGGTA